MKIFHFRPGGAYWARNFSCGRNNWFEEEAFVSSLRLVGAGLGSPKERKNPKVRTLEGSIGVVLGVGVKLFVVLPKVFETSVLL